MVELSGDAMVLMNLAAFVAFVVVGGLQIYMGRSTSPQRKITFPWINLALGTFMIGINYLIQAIFPAQTAVDPTIGISSYLLVIGGAALSFTSFLILYMERSNEAKTLRDRQDDLHQIMDRIRKKFLSRELPEDEMRKIDTDLVRELAEIEVKLDKINRKK